MSDGFKGPPDAVGWHRMGALAQGLQTRFGSSRSSSSRSSSSNTLLEARSG